MESTRVYPETMGLPGEDRGDLPSSMKHFPNGVSFRIHRINQGSGVMLLTDAGIKEMEALGEEHNIEVCLFVGPRAAWDVGIQITAASARIAAGALRSAEQAGSNRPGAA